MEGKRKTRFTIAMAVGVLLHFGAVYFYSLPKVEERWPAYVCGIVGALALMLAAAMLARAKGRPVLLGAVFGVFSVVGLILLSMMPAADSATGMREEDLNAPPEDFELMQAARQGSLEQVVARLEAGASIDGRERSGRSALHVALGEGHIKLALALLERGADAKARDRMGNTPLHLAAEMGSWQLCEALLDRGAEIDLQGNDGWTALHCAAAWNAKGVVIGLVERGADLKILNGKGMTPKQQAEFENHSEVADLLRRLEREAAGAVEASAGEEEKEESA